MADALKLLKKQTGVKKKKVVPKQPKAKVSRNRWGIFSNIDPTLFLAAIDDFCEYSKWDLKQHFPNTKIDEQYILMFHSLKRIPWQMARQFLTKVAKDDSTPAYIQYKKFLADPVNIKKINKSKQFIETRKAIPYRKPVFSKNKQTIEEIIAQIKQNKPKKRREVSLIKVIKQTKQHKPIQFTTELIPEPTKRVKDLFGNEFLSQCEREYHRAVWLKSFSDAVIRGFAVSDEQSEFATNATIVDSNNYVWYKVNTLFYKKSCQGERRFKQDSVAYVTTEGDIIVETEDMFKASLYKWKESFRTLTPTSFTIAKQMLMENNILLNTFKDNTQRLEEYVDGIIASFGPLKTNHDIARKLSYVLVFLTPLINKPQIYHTKVQNLDYPATTLIGLDRQTLLPEIFDVTISNTDEVERFIKKSRARIEQTFYQLIDNEIYKQKQYQRKIQPHKRVEVIRPVPVRFAEYHQEATQPKRYAHKPKTREIPELVNSNQTNNKQDELAPGLLCKLKEIISKNTEIKCATCNSGIGHSTFNTIINAEKISFCNIVCFEKFKM